MSRAATHRSPVIVDAGPLVAALNRHDRYHHWASMQLAEIEPPLLTCEAALAEAFYLLRGIGGANTAVTKLIRRDLLRIELSLQEEIVAVEKLLDRFADRPISLADACLVRMAELCPGSSVLTIDDDFLIYRIHGRRVIPTIMPKPS